MKHFLQKLDFDTLADKLVTNKDVQRVNKIWLQGAGWKKNAFAIVCHFDIQDLQIELSDNTRSYFTIVRYRSIFIFWTPTLTAFQCEFVLVTWPIKVDGLILYLGILKNKIYKNVTHQTGRGFLTVLPLPKKQRRVLCQQVHVASCAMSLSRFMNTCNTVYRIWAFYLLHITERLVFRFLSAPRHLPNKILVWHRALASCLMLK